MLNQKNHPTIFHDDNGTFIDYSRTLLDYSRDTASVSLVAADDKLYFGRVKPFRSFYIEMDTVATSSAIVTVKYYDTDAAAFTAVDNLIDETNGFKRSGFMTWDHVNNSTSTPWVTNSVNSETLYWVQITVDTNLTGSPTMKGWNIVFSDDNDMGSIYDGATNFLVSGTDSGILYHQNAKRQILNTLAREGKFKYELGSLNNTSNPAQIDEWDLLDIEEVRLWSAYLALSALFENVSTQTDDKYSQLSEKYMREAGKMKKVFYLTLDLDDDGQRDRQEVLGSNNFSTGTIIRR